MAAADPSGEFLVSYALRGKNEAQKNRNGLLPRGGYDEALESAALRFQAGMGGSAILRLSRGGCLSSASMIFFEGAIGAARQGMAAFYDPVAFEDSSSDAGSWLPIGSR